MSQPTASQVTHLLHQWRAGKREAFDELVPFVYAELRQLARRHMSSERKDHTLQTTALVNEACVKMMGADVDWKDRVHFFAVSSRVMRRILVDHARAHRSAKRGGGEVKIPIDDAVDAAVDRPWDLVDLDEALARLVEQDPRKGRVIELHYFGGMKVDEIAGVLEITPDAVSWDMRMARAWLRKELGDEA